jgi:hypothetical protein
MITLDFKLSLKVRILQKVEVLRLNLIYAPFEFKFLSAAI